jgi:hypothetical protein
LIRTFAMNGNTMVDLEPRVGEVLPGKFWHRMISLGTG